MGKMLWAAVAGVLLLAGQAAAAYPERPITMIVAYGAGGGTDVLARTLMPFVERNLGEGARIVVVNRPGAGGEIGFAALAEAAPDGYTLGFINTPNVVTIPIERQARYTLDRFDPLVNIIDDPGAMAVHADSAIKSLADLVEEARARPNTVTVGTTGVGSDDHLAMLLLQRQSKIKLTHVPFPGNSAALAAVLGRHIVAVSENIGEAARDRQDNPLRVLGVMSAARWNQAETVPTFREQGYDIVISALRGIAAPKGLPPEIRARVVDAVTRAVNDPEFQEKARQTFQPLRVLDSEAYAAELKEMDREFRKLWQDSPWAK